MEHQTEPHSERAQDADAGSSGIAREVERTQPGDWVHVITPEGRIRIRVMADRVEVESDADQYVLVSGRLV
jgi:hypothetical protein